MIRDITGVNMYFLRVDFWLLFLKISLVLLSSQNTFLGRLRHFIDIIDPSTLFVSEVKSQFFMFVSF